MGSSLHNHTSGVQSNRVFTSKVRIFRFKKGSVNYLRLTKRKSRPGMRDRDKDPVTRKHARPVKGERERARAEKERERLEYSPMLLGRGLATEWAERSRDGYPGREKCGPKPHTTRSPAHTLHTPHPHRYRRASHKSCSDDQHAAPPTRTKIKTVWFDRIRVGCT